MRRLVPCERAAVAAVALLGCALVAGAVAAVMLASVSARGLVAHQGGDRYQVTAHVVGSQVADPQLAVGVPGAVPYSERLAWTWHGTRHVGREMVTVASTRSATKQVWVDGSGDKATPPMLRSDIATISGLVGVGAGLLALTALGIAIAVLRGWLLRRRLHDWQGEWERIAPLWTGYSGRY